MTSNPTKEQLQQIERLTAEYNRVLDENRFIRSVADSREEELRSKLAEITASQLSALEACADYAQQVLDARLSLDTRIAVDNERIVNQQVQIDELRTQLAEAHDENLALRYMLAGNNGSTDYFKLIQELRAKLAEAETLKTKLIADLATTTDEMNYFYEKYLETTEILHKRDITYTAIDMENIDLKDELGALREVANAAEARCAACLPDTRDFEDERLRKALAAYDALRSEP